MQISITTPEKEFTASMLSLAVSLFDLLCLFALRIITADTVYFVVGMPYFIFTHLTLTTTL